MSTIEIPQTIVPETCFLDTIPKAPEGRYAHILMIRETESYSVFQTDGTLNIANVKRGIEGCKTADSSRYV